MAAVDGAYDCVTKTPMGDQSGVFTVISNGDRFHGTIAGALGSMDVEDGTVDGNTLRWKMKMSFPMPISIDAEAVVEGDTVTGTLQLGAFGAAAITGKRRA
jgi:hypothetical protein